VCHYFVAHASCLPRLFAACARPAGKYRGIWTGKQLVSMIIPDVNLNAEVKLDASLNPKDETVIIDRVRGRRRLQACSLLLDVYTLGHPHTHTCTRTSMDVC
jgi:hypothetical protein